MPVTRLAPLSWFVTILIIWFGTGCAPRGARALLEGKRLIDRGNYSAAVKELRLATSDLATNAQAWNYLGLAYHHAGQAAEAERAYLRALQLDRDLSETHYNLGCLWLDQNRADKLEAAKSELTAFSLRRSDSVDGLLRLGSAQLRSREYTAAEKTFGEALRLSPQNAEALNGLGLARIQRGRVNEGLQYFSSALKRQPNYRPAMLNVAIVAHQYMKDRGLALQKYREYLASAPAAAPAPGVTELVHQLEQELNPPPRPVVTNVLAPPSPAVTNHPLHASPAPTNVPVATKSVATSPPAQPSNPLPSTNLVKTELATPPPERTIAAVPTEPTVAEPKPVSDSPTLALAEPPSTAHPLITTSGPPARPAPPLAESRGLLQRLNPLNLFRSQPNPPTRSTPLLSGTKMAADNPRPGNSSQTAQPRYTYRLPAKPAPGNRTAAEKSFTQGLRAYQDRRLSEAIQAYKQSLQADPSFFKAQYNLGLTTAESGDLQAALAAYETALAIEPDSLDAHYNFALALKQGGYITDSLNEFERMVATHPDEARAHLALGNIYAQQLHQPAKARQHYLRVLEIDPHYPRADDIRFWLSANPAR
jgi:tetratricopeptide (TPR) repeat protein